MPPPTVTIGLNGSIQEYFRRRVIQALHDSYVGVPMLKFPEDLRTYEHLLWEHAPDVVIEIGTHMGGSALWFRDRLELLVQYGRVAAPRVVSLDLDKSRAAAAIAAVDPGYEATITLVEGDLRDDAVQRRVAEVVALGTRCMVVEDSAHVYETTRAALDAFGPYVQPGGFFVVEDGCVDIDELRADPTWPRGVLPAVRDWLESPAGSGFAVRRDLELYGVSCHPGGFLQRIG
jgi:cephalosporin hydroxylase